MKVKDLLKKITDNGLCFEFRGRDFSSYGFYKLNELKYNTKFNNDLIYNINIQYINNKRTIVITIK